MAKNNNVVKFRKGINFDLGFIIFFIIIIFVLFKVFSYITSSKIAEYEVVQGTIATNNVYRGLILRDETIEYANEDGYINYYLKNGSKASVNDIIYSVDTTGEISKRINNSIEEGMNIDDKELRVLLDDINIYNKAYSGIDFSSAKNFKQLLQSELTHTLNSNALNSLSSQVDNAEANNTFYKYTSSVPGIISYYVDGYENIKPENVTEDNFTAYYEKIELANEVSIKRSAPAYKRINSEEWNIILPISDSTASELGERQYVKINICKDDFTINAPCSVMKKSGKFYLNLSLKTGMIRYLDDRFIDVELKVLDESGLKIPNSAITSKDFYTIPKEFVIEDTENEKISVMVKEVTEGSDSVVVKTPNIYKITEDVVYVDLEDLNIGDIIVKKDSQKTYTFGNDTAPIVGAYNINKGYAVFKQIEVISQNDNYSIINTRTSYGLSLYDHIALDGNKIEENQTITR